MKYKVMLTLALCKTKAEIFTVLSWSANCDLLTAGDFCDIYKACIEKLHG